MLGNLADRRAHCQLCPARRTLLFLSSSIWSSQARRPAWLDVLGDRCGHRLHHSVGRYICERRAVPGFFAKCGLDSVDVGHAFARNGICAVPGNADRPSVLPSEPRGRAPSTLRPQRRRGDHSAEQTFPTRRPYEEGLRPCFETHATARSVGLRPASMSKPYTRASLSIMISESGIRSPFSSQQLPRSFGARYAYFIGFRLQLSNDVPIQTLNRLG